MVDIEIKDVDPENIDEEHICCAIGNDKTNKERAQLKKDWLKNEFPKGHRFKKYDVRGKVFIEYSPAEAAWFPVVADGYHFIQCLWVSGRFKGQGLSRGLLEEMEKDIEGSKGIVAIASDKKRGFMVHRKFYQKMGFVECDSAPPFFHMMVKKFDEDAPDPRFTEKAKRCKLEGGKGLTFFYSHLCPFNEAFTDIMIEAASRFDVEVTKVKVETSEQAKDLPTPWGVFSVFLDEDLLSHEVTTMNKFEKILEEKLGN
jgi:GNAT superfamily N-acetyltransferase